MLILALTDMIWWGIGYGVARLILPLVSFGKVRVAPLDSVGEGFGRLGYNRDGSGNFQIEPTLGAGVGIFFCCVGLAIVLYFIR